MDEYELAQRVTALPDRFAGRLDEGELGFVRSAARVGEWGEAVDLMIAGLVQTKAMVTPGERDELAAVVAYMGLETTESVDDLTVADGS